MRNNIRVLIVDDAEYIRTMTISMLHNIDIHITYEADNGQAALDIIRSREIDLVLLDVVMPGMSGLVVLKDIRADAKISATKVILVTAAADSKTILLARANSTRADAIIVKPFSVTTLREKIDQVMKYNGTRPAVSAR